MASFDEMLAKLKKELKAEKAAKKEPDPYREKINEVRKQLKDKNPRKKINGKGYEYVRDEEGRMRTKAQVEWEKFHERKVQDHERVLFKDGDKTNFSKDNLVLAYKYGVSLDLLTCRNCGCRGNWQLETKEG